MVTTIQIPEHINMTTLSDVGWCGENVRKIVVWADRPYDTCPRCGQGIGRTPCPVTLNGDVVEQIDISHHCGMWMRIDWEILGENASERSIAQVAQKLDIAREQRVERGKERTRERLHGMIAAARQRIIDGDDPEDVCDGSEAIAGVYMEDGRLTAWDYGPIDDGSIVTVDENDLAA